MADAAKAVRRKIPADVPLYTRVARDDHDEMKAEEIRTGATLAAQARILIHEALAARRVAARRIVK